MRLLLQHASRALFSGSVRVAAPPRGSLSNFSSSAAACWSCQCRALTTSGDKRWDNGITEEVKRRNDVRRRWFSVKRPSEEEKKMKEEEAPSEPIMMPPPPEFANEGPPREKDEPKITEIFEDVAPATSKEPTEAAKDETTPSSDAMSMPPPPAPEEEIKAPEPEGKTEEPSKPATEPEYKDTIARVPAEDLPSHRETQRWDFSKRMQELMDDILPKLAVVTQKVNTYTGTDYSSIEALRREIKDQGTSPRSHTVPFILHYPYNPPLTPTPEKLVKARRTAIDDAKAALDTAHAQQSASQKEVVALLERKHSWSAGDLERYMSLIRSEHLNDRAIREAKDAVSAAENALEEARGQLEKRERQQYHEEQIWSDTIRRNSTWVTFGLMGVNIFLLLLSLLFIEPWRRRRMVREIKEALVDSQKSVAAAATAAANATTTAPLVFKEAGNESVVVEREAVELPPQESTPETAHTATAASTSAPTEPAPETTEPLPTELAPTPYHTANPATEPPVPLTEEQETALIAGANIEEELEAAMTPMERFKAKIERIPDRLESLVSEEPVMVRKKDLTATVCVSLALGYAAALVAFWIGTR